MPTSFAISWRHRRIAYLVGIGLGAPVLALSWQVERRADGLLLWAYPVVLVLLVGAFVAMLVRAEIVLPLERVAIFSMMALWLTRLVFLSFRDAPTPDIWDSLAPWAFMGVPLFVVFSYIVLETRRAAIVAFVFGGAAAAVLVARFAREGVVEDDWSYLVAFARYQCYLFVTVAFVHLLARSKDAAVVAELEAERMRTMAYRDPLTGLPNRRALVELLEGEVDPSRRTPLSVIAFDLDRFKEVNDALGHPAGDLVLQAAGLTVQQQLRAGDTAGRWGGEEFLVVLPHTSRAQADDLAERLRRTLEDRVRVADEPVTASFGVVQYEFGMTVDDLVARADAMMYAAKTAGRNRVVSGVPRPRVGKHPDDASVPSPADLRSGVERLDEGT
jgi:diguanylate cyclase (GGDEF)-like protein